MPHTRSVAEALLLVTDKCTQRAHVRMGTRTMCHQEDVGARCGVVERVKQLSRVQMPFHLTMSEISLVVDGTRLAGEHSDVGTCVGGLLAQIDLIRQPAVLETCAVIDDGGFVLMAWDTSGLRCRHHFSKLGKGRRRQRRGLYHLWRTTCDHLCRKRINGRFENSFIQKLIDDLLLCNMGDVHGSTFASPVESTICQNVTQQRHSNISQHRHSAIVAVRQSHKSRWSTATMVFGAIETNKIEPPETLICRLMQHVARVATITTVASTHDKHTQTCIAVHEASSSTIHGAVQHGACSRVRDPAVPRMIGVANGSRGACPGRFVVIRQ
mmetsp:Transcript_46832/g.124370  ORF Transcript_46832/g.124370 Transcript_46832/m.124370 type:complete len:326 (+) Transcript_46832:862-1839(+)